jgi:hypothetical protein
MPSLVLGALCGRFAAQGNILKKHRIATMPGIAEFQLAAIRRAGQICEDVCDR